ncbi:TonB-dependent receptor [Sphingomonas melonis TY]|uniref:TonB-dependent receptor n=1 Tax=Sphingomonas melonis TY TaxID=621456 RepID=A0A154NCX7_9SPHN|nr:MULTISPECIES: TonB-dependent siderophore receptor [Sphingomonas]AOW23974.1 TonB-dependent receptor [Sphingomonas melonis TY]ATI55009.1 TonB-dependent siderophore receptor [Sphingomonas melonis]KZB96619.1 TonB-dependent receptor [Sphingomonas melonis TY]MBX8843476.1 TonB-dependent siderophore receptor [Sphingomonas melonis]MBX8853080.1 TonB-dependent siderophore receptor [Sphingomonas melonis]
MLLRSRVAACLSPLIACLPITPAAAQDTDDVAVGSGDIVVLGTRRARSDGTLSSDIATRTLSQSSRSIERDLLTAAGTYRLSDALELVSGVSNQNNRGGVMDNFAIRGFLGTPDGGGEYYVDCFLANRGMGPPRDPATTERIELLKGPAGALFGDIDPAGRVNIVSKTPDFVPAAYAVFTLGSFGTRRVELDATGPVSRTLAARIVVAAETSDGWRNFVGLDRQVVMPSLTWRPSEQLRVTYIGEITRFDTLFDRGIPALDGNANAVPRDAYYGEPNDGQTRFRNQRHQLTALADLGNDWTVTGGVAWRTGTLKGFSSDQSRLVGGRTLWRQRRSRDFKVDDLSARIELAGHVGSHRPSIGLKGYTLDYAERWMRRNPGDPARGGNPYAIDVFAPVYGQTPPTLLPFTNNREKRWSGTVYVQDMWDVTDRLTLSGGARFDAYRQRIRNNNTGQVGRTVGSPMHYRLGARYQATDAIAVHASWGESFVLNSGTGRDGNGFAPESGVGYEVGVAGRWAGVDVAATWFDIRKRGILANDPVDPAFNAPVGSLRSRGIEWDASVRIAPHWQIVGNYAWTRARVDDGAFPTDRALNVPDHSGTVFALGRFTDDDGRGVSVSAGASYMGDRAGSIERDYVVLPAYLKAKAAVEYAVSPRLTLRAEADNLFDARYAQSSYSRVWIYPGQPRNVRLSLRVSS